jgi:cob(I)alamin adenosyltransferase
MKIYTKTGDKGTTGLIGRSRVSKDHLRIESYGTVDELNSYIGLIKDQAIENQIKEVLIRIQHDLFTLGSMLATPTNKQTLKNGEQRLNIPEVDTKSVTYLEKEIDKMNEKLTRCVCRRAERLSVSLHEQEGVNPITLTYLNRLSDFLFMLARKLSQDLSVQEVKWIPEKL